MCFERSKAANAQGYEDFPLFAIASLAGLHAGLSPRSLVGLGWTLVGLRVLFSVLSLH